MIQAKTPLPLPEILNLLESVTAALKAADVERSRQLQARAAELLRARTIDCGDAMILGKVMARIRTACPHPSITLDLESSLSQA